MGLSLCDNPCFGISSAHSNISQIHPRFFVGSALLKFARKHNIIYHGNV